MNPATEPPGSGSPKRRRIPVEYVPVQHEYPVREVVGILPALCGAVGQAKRGRRLDDSGTSPGQGI